MMNWIQFAAFIITASAEVLAGRVPPLDGAVSICRESYDGKFEVSINKLGKRDIEVSRQLHSHVSVFHLSCADIVTETIILRWFRRSATDTPQWYSEGCQGPYWVHCLQLPIPIR